MTYGYSLRLIEKNKEADEQHLGVRLGRVCIAREIPVSEIATKFNVTRQTVYNWFSGVVSPADTLTDDIEAFLVGS